MDEQSPTRLRNKAFGKFDDILFSTFIEYYIIIPTLEPRISE
jgi:hypothetical protein